MSLGVNRLLGQQNITIKPHFKLKMIQLFLFLSSIFTLCWFLVANDWQKRRRRLTFFQYCCAFHLSQAVAITWIERRRIKTKNFFENSNIKNTVGFQDWMSLWTWQCVHVQYMAFINNLKAAQVIVSGLYTYPQYKCGLHIWRKKNLIKCNFVFGVRNRSQPLAFRFGHCSHP